MMNVGTPDISIWKIDGEINKITITYEQDRFQPHRWTTSHEYAIQ